MHLGEGQTKSYYGGKEKETYLNDSSEWLAQHSREYSSVQYTSALFGWKEREKVGKHHHPERISFS